MNGPAPMYGMRQIVEHNLKVDLPDCMYKLENIHSSRNGVVGQSADHVSLPKNLDIFDQNNEKNDDMAELETRQQHILQQLGDIKKQMDLIKEHLQLPPKLESTPIPTTQAYQPNDLPNEIIINANPACPPYSISILQKLLENNLHLSVISHQHSSLQTLNEKLLSFIDGLENFKPKSQVPVINLKMIWKESEVDMELVFPQTRVRGEVNFLRYIARLMPYMLNYETSPMVNEIDCLLDVSYKILKAKTKTERAQLLQILNKSLGKKQFLIGRFSVADLAAYSVFKQVLKPNEINVNLGMWLQRCETF